MGKSRISPDFFIRIEIPASSRRHGATILSWFEALSLGKKALFPLKIGHDPNQTVLPTGLLKWCPELSGTINFPLFLVPPNVAATWQPPFETC